MIKKYFIPEYKLPIANSTTSFVPRVGDEVVLRIPVGSVVCRSGGNLLGEVRGIRVFEISSVIEIDLKPHWRII